MKRSEIDRLIDETINWLKNRQVCLPPFAEWSAEDWADKGSAYDEIRENMLGWDVTDYGHGTFDTLGLLLFTIRNGNLNNPRFAKPYAEKMLVSQVGQISPNHFHWSKMEDIINRGGGDLCLKLWNSTPDEDLADTDVTVRIDGCETTLPAGSVLRLKPGQSITIPPLLYHMFWAEGERCLAWEVSMMNDDNTDNRFYEPQLRFTEIEEDVPARHLLCNEYDRAY